jgi:hypothetical protein
VTTLCVLQAGLDKELSNLYSSLETLKVSDVQDVDFASTLLVLEKVRLGGQSCRPCFHLLYIVTRAAADSMLHTPPALGCSDFGG